MSVVLACDLGGTSLRAALVDREGDVLAQRAIASVPVSVDARGGSEVDADDWWRAFVAVAGELAADAPERFRQVRAVAICGITRTQVLLRVVLRAALPSIATGIHLGLLYAWLATLGAEYLLASGLGIGNLLTDGREHFWMDQVLLGVIVVGTVGYVLNLAASWLEGRSMAWRRGASARY